MAIQKDLPGTEKTQDQIKDDVRRLREAMAGCMGLPGRNTDLVNILVNATGEDLSSIVAMCKAITPRVRMLGAIATETLQGR